MGGPIRLSQEQQNRLNQLDLKLIDLRKQPREAEEPLVQIAPPPRPLAPLPELPAIPRNPNPKHQELQVQFDSILRAQEERRQADERGASLSIGGANR
jgi:hypothetical protein